MYSGNSAEVGNVIPTPNFSPKQTGVPDTIPPSAPTNLQGSVHVGPPGFISFTWNPSTDNASNVYGIRYKLYIDGQPTSIVVSNKTALTVSLDGKDIYISPSRPHTFFLDAYDDAGNDTTSNTITLNISSSNFTLNVTPPDNGRIITNDGFISCRNAPGTSCSHTYSNGAAVILQAVPDSSYFFTGWKGSLQNPDPCAPPQPQVPTCIVIMNQSWTVEAAFSGIPAPTGLTAMATSPTSVTLWWNALVSIDGYKVYRDGILLANQPLFQSSQNFTDNGVRSNTTYNYTIRSYTGATESSDSVAATVKTPPALDPVYSEVKNLKVNIIGVNAATTPPASRFTVADIDAIAFHGQYDPADNVNLSLAELYSKWSYAKLNITGNSYTYVLSPPLDQSSSFETIATTICREHSDYCDADIVGFDIAFYSSELFSSMGGTFFFGPIYHEFGHSLGLVHAGLIVCDHGAKVIDAFSNCYTQEGQDPYDPMGVRGVFDHGGGVSSYAKYKLGWFAPSNITKAMSDGDYTLASLSQPTTLPQVIIIDNWPGSAALPYPYYLEYRPKIGLQLRLANGQSFLLSWNPSVGSTFDDPLNGIHITVLDMNSTIAKVHIHFDASKQPKPIFLVSPRPSQDVSERFTLYAEVAGGSNIAGVQFKVDGVNLGPEIMSAPYGMIWDTRQNGRNPIVTAVGLDANGKEVARSSAQTYSSGDTIPPVLTLDDPKSGDTICGLRIFHATASDNFRLNTFQYVINANPVNYLVGPPFLYYFDSTSVVNGPYTITAKATDSWGNTTIKSAQVTVSNPCR